MDFSKMLDEELIFVQKTFPSKEDAIRFLSGELIKKDMVKGSFLDAVLSREKKYPTGIYIGSINVAIPHTDIKHVKKSGVAILTLKKPVKFNRMDSPNEEIPVHIIFLLAVSEPDEYVKFLSRLTRSFGKQGIIEKIYTGKNINNIYKILQGVLKDKEEAT